MINKYYYLEFLQRYGFISIPQILGVNNCYFFTKVLIKEQALNRIQYKQCLGVCYGVIDYRKFKSVIRSVLHKYAFECR